MKNNILHFRDIKVGDEAPSIIFPTITRTQIVKYAGASGDFNPIHHDELYAIRAGNNQVFAMGMLTAGILSHMVTDWIGDGNLKKYNVRFVNRIWPGDTVICKGKIKRKYVVNGINYIEAEVSAENQLGEKAITGNIIAELRDSNSEPSSSQR